MVFKIEGLAALSAYASAFSCEGRGVMGLGFKGLGLVGFMGKVYPKP